MGHARGRPALARHSDSHGRAGRRAAADRVRAELAADRPAKSSPDSSSTLPFDAPAGKLAVQTILSSPETGASTARTFYYLSIAAARRIDLTSPIPTSCPTRAPSICSSPPRRRGVDVRVMVAGIHNDNWMARQNSVRLYGPLLEAGIEIFEYNHTMLHQKTMVVDGVWSTVGTTNFDSRSFAHNEENNVCVCDAALARELEGDFRRRTSRAARR